MDLEALALAVDERIRVPAAERRDGRLYAVRSGPAVAPDPDCAGRDGGSRDDDDDDGGDDGTGGAGAAVVLELLAEGEARTIPQKIRPPAGVQAIALASGVWAAPMEPEGPSLRPSQHPERRRAHLTVVVGREADHDGVDVSVLRYGDGSPTVMRGGVGLIHQRMLRCWSRRPDAPWATRRPPAAA
jgi:hypothetical protein